jgi:hypothetical protein
MKNDRPGQQVSTPTLTRAVRLLPLAGVAYAALSVAGDLTIGPYPDASASPAELRTYFAHHASAVRAGGLLMIVAAYCLCLFGVAVWSRIRTRPGTTAVSAFVLACTAVGVVSELAGAGTYVLLGNVGTNPTISPVALQAIQAGSQFGAGGGTLFMLGLFAAGAFGAALPRWLAWSALALGIAALSQFGFLASMLFLVWSAVAGLVLSMRAVPGSSPATPAEARAAVGS